MQPACQRETGYLTEHATIRLQRHSLQLQAAALDVVQPLRAGRQGRSLRYLQIQHAAVKIEVRQRPEASLTTTSNDKVVLSELH